MKKEIIVGVIAAILASLITYFATRVDRQLTKVQLQEIASNIVNNDSFSAVLLNEFIKDGRFHGKDGKDGIPGLSGLVKVGTNWCATLGESDQICWGYHDLSTENSHFRSFNFKYAAPFSSAPVITNGTNANSSGWAFSVYSNNLTEFGYSGNIVEHTSRKNVAPVRMNYIAIGKK